MILTTAVAVLGVLAVGVLVGWRLPRARHIRTQLIAFGAVAVVLPLAAVLVSGVEMLDRAQVLELAVVGAASGATATTLAVLLASRLAERVERLRDAAETLAGGDLGVRIEAQAPEELRQLALAFNEMARSLGRRFDSRRNLFAWATHDLRTPLSSLQAMIEALEDGLAEPADYLPEMRRQVQHLSRLVDDLFELSRIESGALVLQTDDVAVAELAAGCVQALRPQARGRGVRLEMDCTDAQVRARCAPDKVERVLLNLLTNALRHTPHDGTVAVRVHEDGEAVTVAVEDTVEGLPEGAEERVFESFWRADRARRQPVDDTEAGTGLGLAIARGLVEAQGGRIWAENRSEGGARVAFTLPAA